VNVTYACTFGQLKYVLRDLVTILYVVITFNTLEDQLLDLRKAIFHKKQNNSQILHRPE
jgi:hypothetical protein